MTRWRPFRCCKACSTRSTSPWSLREASAPHEASRRCSPRERPAPGSARRCSRRARRPPALPPGQRLLAADDTGTAHGRVFDVALRLDWPEEYGGRGLRNAYFDRWRDRLDELADDDDAAAELAQAQRDQDLDTAYVYAGQGVGLLAEERPVAEVLAELARAEELLRAW